MNKLVIFDLDGTLLDTLPDISYYVNQTLVKFGYPTHEDDKIMQFIGNGARNLIKNALPNGTSEKVVDQCLEYYNNVYTQSNSPRTRLFDGVKQVVSSLKAGGYYTAILTNKPQMTTDVIYERYMLNMKIDKVVGQRDGIKIKPDPQTTLQILKEFNVSKQNAYLVGDGETDVLTAINAGINGISALWGYRTKAQLELAGSKHFAKSVFELLNLIK